ncbi:hypothetical protein EBT31_11050 [bacterium]|nr:hypothetical protein [bacterium]
MHLLAGGTHHGVIFSLSAGNRHDAPEGRKLLQKIILRKQTKVAMDKAYGDKKTRRSIKRKGGIPVVPPKSNAKRPWKNDGDSIVLLPRYHNPAYAFNLKCLFRLRR